MLVQTLGTAQQDSVSSVSIATTGTVTPGNSIIVAAATATGGLDVTGCSDNAGNTYQVDVTLVNFGAGVALCSAHGVSGSPTTITVTFSGTAIQGYASAAEFAGLATSGTVDKTATGTAASSTAATASTSTTSQASELLIGAFSHNGTGRIYTPGDNGTISPARPCTTTGTTTYTALPIVADSPTSQVLLPEYCIVSAPDAYRASSTLNPSTGWNAILVTYKASLILPVVTLSGGSLGYTENASAVPIDPGLTLTGPDGSMTATVQITGNFTAGQDILAFTDQGGITGNVVGNALTLTGATSIASLQAALRTVTYANSSDNPNTTPRTVTFTVDNGVAAPASDTRDITVTAINDPPTGVNKTVTTPEDTPFTFGTIDFGFSDPIDASSHTLLAVRITTLPAADSLTNNGVAVSAGQLIPVADITAGRSVPRRLRTPAAPVSPASRSRSRTTAAPPTAASTSTRRPAR